MSQLKPIAHILFDQVESKPHFSELCISTDVEELQNEAEFENDVLGYECGDGEPAIVVAPVYGHEFVNSLLVEIAELKAKLAKPVILPERWDIAGQVNPPLIVVRQFDQQNAMHDHATKAITKAGFKWEIEK